MRVGVDIDGVTLDFQNHWMRLYEEWFGLPVTPRFKGTWNCVVSGTHFETDAKFFEWFNRAGGWDNMPWIPGAPGAIDRLLDDGHQVVFITSRSMDAGVPTGRWFESTPWSRDAQLRVGVKNKSIVPCGVYIDDAPHVIKELQQAGKNTIVFDQPWNAKASGPRAKNWTEVLELIGEM
jgi:5'(3')-deoxyribonucleotidase